MKALYPPVGQSNLGDVEKPFGPKKFRRTEERRFHPLQFPALSQICSWRLL